MYLTLCSGGIAGSPFSAWIADRFGRRASMAIGAVIIIIGAILAAAAHNFGALVGGRFILGMGISVMTVAAPAYAIEIAPPQWRGRVTGASAISAMGVLQNVNR